MELRENVVRGKKKETGSLHVRRSENYNEEVQLKL